MKASSAPITLPQTRLLASVINTTRSMLTLAEEQQWDAVADLELLRREDLKQCFEIPVHDNQNDLISEALAVLLHMNEELMTKLAKARENVVEECGVQAATVAAVNEYQRMRSLK